MKAQDLRIGNLVKRYLGANEYKPIVLKSISDTGEFTYIDQDEKTLYLVRNNFKGLQPIELTEDWLLKMGFQKKQIRKDLKNKFGDYAFSLEKVKFYTLIQDNDGFMVSKFETYITTIKYVHQLQNIYHALTGEELTIK